MTTKYTQIAILKLLQSEARYAFAVVSDISEDHCLEMIEESVEGEFMLPLSVICLGGYKLDRIETVSGSEWKYAVMVDEFGEIVDSVK